MQRRLADAFVKSNEDLIASDKKLRAKRLARLRAARDGGVYGTTLADMSGLAHSRLYQLEREMRRDTDTSEGATTA
jgi:hypothetical protein